LIDALQVVTDGSMLLIKNLMNQFCLSANFN